MWTDYIHHCRVYSALYEYLRGYFKPLLSTKWLSWAKPTMDLITWRASAGVWSHGRAKCTINILKLAVMQSIFYFDAMADFIWSPIASGDDYKGVFVNDEGADSAIEPPAAAPPACARVMELYMWGCKCLMCLCNCVFGSLFVFRINAARLHFLFSSCHFHLRSPIKFLPAFRMLMSSSWLRVSPWIPDRRYFQ